jgi:hypothetical protein
MIYTNSEMLLARLKALCNEFFDGEIFALRYSVLCTGSKDANRFPKLQVALFL